MNSFFFLFFILFSLLSAHLLNKSLIQLYSFYVYLPSDVIGFVKCIGKIEPYWKDEAEKNKLRLVITDTKLDIYVMLCCFLIVYSYYAPFVILCSNMFIIILGTMMLNVSYGMSVHLKPTQTIL